MMSIWEHLTVAKQAYDKATDAVCRKYKIKHREFDILMYLANNPNQATATDIVKKHNLSKSHVSVSLRALEERGFVVGEFHGTNRRTIYLKLIDGAKEVLDEGKAAQKEFFDAVFGGFSQEELKNFANYISRLKKNITQFSKH